MLAAHPEGFAARHEHLQLRALLEEPGDAVGRGHHLLEVVEQQQHVPAPQPLLQQLECGLVARPGEADGSNDRLERGLRIAHRCEVDEVHAVLEPVDLVRRRLQG